MNLKNALAIAILALAATGITIALACTRDLRVFGTPLPISDVHEYGWSGGRNGLCICVPCEAKTGGNRVSIEVHPDFDNQWIVSKCRCVEENIPLPLQEQNPDSDDLLHGEMPTILRQVSIRDDGHSLAVDLYCLEAGKKYNLYFLLYPRRRGADVGIGKRQALSDFRARG